MELVLWSLQVELAGDGGGGISGFDVFSDELDSEGFGGGSLRGTRQGHVMCTLGVFVLGIEGVEAHLTHCFLFFGPLNVRQIRGWVSTTPGILRANRRHGDRLDLSVGRLSDCNKSPTKNALRLHAKSQELLTQPRTRPGKPSGCQSLWQHHAPLVTQ